ncbi:hypothetical protein Lepto7375DRAFT_2135 [Leptolyngbya sp. PCC 7375]|nr:hypothetical protein Lepto7375DRAFT_2135 [Leptolyngbya sp. PCC 7375]
MIWIGSQEQSLVTICALSNDANNRIAVLSIDAAAKVLLVAASQTWEDIAVSGQYLQLVNIKETFDNAKFIDD